MLDLGGGVWCPVRPRLSLLAVPLALAEVMDLERGRTSKRGGSEADDFRSGENLERQASGACDALVSAQPLLSQ
jgi:hypothetical protein